MNLKRDVTNIPSLIILQHRGALAHVTRLLLPPQRLDIGANK